MRIALVPNLEKPDAVRAARELVPLLAGQTVTLIEHEEPLDHLKASAPDLIVVLGGDGSILRIASALDGLHPPVVGINFGKLGYLAAYYLDQFKAHLPAILAGTAPISERLMLRAEIYRRPHRDHHTLCVNDLVQQTPLYSGTALNDVVINSGAPFRMVELHVRINDHDTTKFRSDGLIVATPSGSTGYNLSAGGALLTPQVPAMAITPICAHSLSFRPIIVPQDSAIVVHPHRVNPGTALSFDGQTNHPFEPDDIVLIRKAEYALKLVENPDMTHWQMLAHKLHWAANPRS
jgi:NAD+ kinase